MDSFDHNHESEGEGFIKLSFKHSMNNLIGHLKEEKDSFDHKDAPTVILVPGFTCTNGSLSELGNYLKETMNVAYAPSFHMSNTGSVATSARELAEKLALICLQSNDGNVSLVGHSLGGLIAVAGLKTCVKLKINSIITMGTPFYGTPKAQPFVKIFQACKDMQTPGGYLQLTSIGGQLKGKLNSMISDNDSIVPPASQIPNPGIAPKKTRVIHWKNYEHVDFLIGDKMKQVANIIQKCVI